MTKFKVGQVWADRIGDLRTITEIGCEADTFYNITSEASDGQRATHNKDGQVWSHTTIALDLITLVKDTEETVTDKLTMDYSTLLPPEPLPGQYYRTKNGRKMLYCMKATRYYLYEDVMTDAVLPYSTAYTVGFNDSSERDIIAPWTDPLPAVEIKRWAIVAKMDVTDNDGDLLKRGEHIFGYDSEVDAINHLKDWSNRDWYEIVELTGTLPAREAT